MKKFCKKIVKQIQKQDVFAPPISSALNIDGNEKHETAFGGFVSICIGCAIILFIY
jgi:hypothetical protein